MRYPLLSFILLSIFAVAAEPAAKPSPDSTQSVVEEPKVEPVTRQASVTIAGKKIPYQVSAGKLVLKDQNGKPRASIFHVTYERTDVKDLINRPVMFAFNGGPGSSAVWLHIGILGPRILDLPGNGTLPPNPPVRMKDNAMSLLDVCDLVFIDPVSTGYSRADKDAKADEFHGLNGDIESVGDFIRRWITEHNRWSSPKYLMGESYGGVRAAGLSQHLQARYGMSLNGVILLSSLLDFRTILDDDGNDLPYSVFLPAYTSTAIYHGKVLGDRAALLRESTDFAFGEYAIALIQGNALSAERRESVATQLSSLTGISKEIWLKHDLRIDASLFRGELLRAEGKVLGRFDARVAWDSSNDASPYPEYDPSYSLAYGAFSTSMMDYLTREIGYKEDQPYEILTGKVHPWKWDSSNSVVNVSGRLEAAIRDNPRLRVLVMNGYTDLATPSESVAHSVRHMLDLPAAVRVNIETVFYDGGHMFYLNPADLEKSRTDLIEFLK